LKIRIANIIGSLDMGGTEKQLFLLLKYMDRKRFSPFVVSLSEGGYWTDRIRRIGVEVIELENHKRYEVGRLFALARILHREKPDVIHCYQPPGNRYGWMAARLCGKQREVVISRRSFNGSGEKFDPYKKMVDRFIFKSAAAVVCNSEALMTDLVKEYGEEIRARVIPNGIEPTHLPNRAEVEMVKIDLGIPAGTKVIGTVGRLVPIKNHRFFLEIAREVLREFPETMFVIVGEGPLKRELCGYAKQIGISDRVLFTGQRGDVIKLLSTFELFLLTTNPPNGTGEGLPNVVMEAMMCGVPCVAFDAGGTKELYRDGEAGFLVNPKDPPTFVRRTLELLSNPVLRSELGLRGMSMAVERHSAFQMMKEHEKLYHSIFEERAITEKV
jgi:glycosyltransferase involved in cell wall biosynthesis